MTLRADESRREEVSGRGNSALRIKNHRQKGKTMNRMITIMLLIAALYAARDWIPLPLFRLPGDFEIRTERVHFLFPLTTCVLISLAFSLFFAIVRRH